MPLTGLYTWEETPRNIWVRIPLKGSSRTSLDIYETDNFLKISFSPYLTQIDLLEKVDYLQSSANIEDGVLIVKLHKVTSATWGTLEVSGTKAELRARREESIARRQKHDQEVFPSLQPSPLQPYLV